MELYTIRRRNAWSSPEELQETGARSAQVGDEMPDDVRWIRTYAVHEDDGTLGTLCIYEASSPEAIRKHAERTGMPADEINAVAETLVIRPDPQAATA
jgi:hypothetical protein